MRIPDPDHLRPDDSVLVISVAAELAGLHAQTLRTYDRLGLVSPKRTRGGGRRYSMRDVARLREVQRLSQDEGINLAGIKIIIELRDHLESIEDELAMAREELRSLRSRQVQSESVPQVRRGELVHVPRSSQVVLWRPRHERNRD